MAIFETDSGERFIIEKTLSVYNGNIIIDGVNSNDLIPIKKNCKCVDICKKS